MRKGTGKWNNILASMLAVSVMVCAAPTAFAAEVSWPDIDFSGPAGILMGSDGKVYIADEKANQVLQIQDEETANVIGGVTLPDTMYGVVAGAYHDGPTAKSLFDSPTSMVEWWGGILVSDTQNHALRLIKNGTVATFAGTGEPGFQDGFGTNASFHLPRGLVVDDGGNLYVADSGNGVIRKIDAKGEVSTYCSGFAMPCGLAYDNGVFYVSDVETHQIYKIVNGKKVLFAGTSVQEEGQWVGGYQDGAASTAKFNAPQGLAVTPEGVYLADTGNAAIRYIDFFGNVSTVISLGNTENAQWPVMPKDVMVADGKLYVADPFCGIVFQQAVNVTPRTAEEFFGDFYYHTMGEEGYIPYTPNLPMTGHNFMVKLSENLREGLPIYGANQEEGAQGFLDTVLGFFKGE